MAETSLDDLLAQVRAAQSEALNLLARGSAEEVKGRFLGRKGEFRRLQAMLGKLSAAERPVFGKAFNDALRAVEEAHAAAAGPKRTDHGPAFDFLPGIDPGLGCRHPLVQTIEEIADIFGRMGFELAQGPEVEDVFHNFIALNIPEDHPARDPRDNFYLRDDLLLRSQTSTVQIRVMERRRPPIRVFAIGRVYRPDPFDATHSPMFHQVEGLWIDEEISFADLKAVYTDFMRRFFETDDLQVRFRPSFFPFTEPSAEIDMMFTSGALQGRWLEISGAGQVHPSVVRNFGLDPERYIGFAFGSGLERLTMLRYGVDDLRLFFEGDLRFLAQFS